MIKLEKTKTRIDLYTKRFACHRLKINCSVGDLVSITVWMSQSFPAFQNALTALSGLLASCQQDGTIYEHRMI